VSHTTIRAPISDKTVELPALVKPAQDGRPTQAVPAAPAAQVVSRLYVLDVLRFFAAMAVVFYHLAFAESNVTWGSGGTELFGPLRSVASYGWMGVELFFLISGFVICMSSWGRSLSEFFVSRVTRLFPAYLFIVVLTASVLALWPQQSGSPPLSQLLGNLTMVQTLLGHTNIDDPYWTLLVELKFYLLFALVVHLGATYRRVLLFCMVWATAAIFAYTAGFKALTIFVEPGFASYFVAGIAFYLIYRFGPNLLLWCIVGFTFVVNAVMLERRVSIFWQAGLSMSWKVGVLILAVFYLLMIGVALGWFKKIKWRGLVTVGALTYPLYLLHMTNGRAVIQLLRHDLPPWILLPGAIAIAVLAAYLIHRFVERPVSRVLRTGLKSSFQRVREAGDA
jgi:peptidoglycan/LPS O-acetylase OafA/YrhL